MCQAHGYPTEREQINGVTGVIDGNNVYGSLENRSRSLRDLQSKQLEKTVNRPLTSKSLLQIVTRTLGRFMPYLLVTV
jgi:hypothetical protein